jgi:hypothetical protein
MESKITVKDLVNISSATIDSLNEVMKELTDLCETYTMTDELLLLEQLKREVLSKLQYMATLFAKIKVFKGPNHTYLENSIKRFKAETITMILESGGNITSAEKKVYTHPYYIERIKVAEKVIAFCITVELAFDHYTSTLSAIIQSISVASKDYSHQRMVN